MRTRFGMLAVFLLALTLIAGCRQAQPPPNSAAEAPFAKADPAKTRGASSAFLFFLNSQVGWAVVNLEAQQPPASIILRTGDGGQNWVQLNSPGLTVVRELAFADQLHGWTLVSADNGDGTTRFSIMATADAGHTWSEQWSQDRPQDGVFYHMQFFDGNQGVVQLGETILATADAGGNWAKRPGPQGATSFSFASPQEGWAASRSSIWHTADGGATWTSQWVMPDKVKDEFVYGAGFIDLTPATGGWAIFEGEGSMFQFSKLVLHADGGGGNWSVASASLPGDLAIFPNNDTPRYRIAQFAPLSEGTALLAAAPPTDYPVLYRTADGGASWETLSDGMSASPGLPKSAWGDLVFVSDSEGWAAVITQSQEDSSAEGSNVALLHTLDGGRTWTAQF
jgi:photosystem II stability/assembly factor-like uncharacterized protein